MLPLGDRHEKDDMENRCGGDIVGTRPRCLNMITTTAEVIRRIEMYFWGGAIEYLSGSRARVIKAALERRADGEKACAARELEAVPA